MKVLLASGSARRIDILSELVAEFDRCSPDADENYLGSSPEDTVTTIALRKWQAVSNKDCYDIVITADTLVYFNGEYLGKPEGTNGAYEMLKKLNGNTHSVVTGIVVSSKDKVLKKAITSSVTFNKLSDEQLKDYIDNHYVLDKAGSYAIQDGIMVKNFTGEYTNIVGMPKNTLQKMMTEVLDRSKSNG
ncbi:MAG: Maf family protein [Bacillota bacterium]